MNTVLQPEGWAKPIGYANGIASRGRIIHLAGLIGWNGMGEFESDDLVDQVRQTLRNIVAVLAEAGAGPEHITSMTWYFVDKRDYLSRLAEVGGAYREVIGRNFPAMAAVQVAALMEDRAKVEIQAVAVIPETAA
jgi:enamine deaminase RidA (YjgF/YER057c/UK114 family)